LLALLILAMTPGAHANTCLPFGPSRQDLDGLRKPGVVGSGDFDEDGTLDLVVVNEEIPGDITHGAVSILSGDGAGGFSLSGYEVIGRNPVSLGLADFNNDQHLDVAVAHFLDKNVTILLGDGDAGFPSKSTLPVAAEPTALAAIDFTGDAVPDLLVATSPGSTFPGNVYVFRGNGDGTFTLHASAQAGVDPRALVTARFNGDSILDVAVGDSLGQSVTIILGTGAGNLAPPNTIPIPGTVNSLVAADFNNDAKPDLAAGAETVGTSIMVLLGDGSGGFALQPTLSLASSVKSVSACDLDRDGKRDLIATRTLADTLSVLLGHGDGTFEPPADLGVNSRPVFVHVYDLNRDSFCDAVTANEAADSLSILLGDGAGQLGTPHFGVGLAPLDAALGDLNNDGKPDAASADRDSNTISILLGNGEGSFTLVTTLQAGTAPGAVIIAEMNGDTSRDVVVVNQGVPGDNQPDTVDVFFGDGTGSFPTRTTLDVGHLPLDVVADDFSGDGIADLATANWNSDNVTVHLGTGGGGFDAGRNFRPGVQPRSLAVLDVDGDGLRDLAVSLEGDNAIGFLMGKANGTFSRSNQTLPGTGFNVDDVLAADVNGDGRKDLLWINQFGAFDPGTISIQLSDGGTWFVEPPGSGLATGTRPEALAVMDLDRQGNIDLVVANRFDNTLSVYLGDGQGGFTPAGSFGTGSEPFSAAVGDLNSDGRLDVLTADFGGNGVSVLLNNSFIDLGFNSVRAATATTFTWDLLPGAGVFYRVYRAQTMSFTQGDYGTCLNAATLADFQDTASPALGQAYFYLVAPVISGVESGLGFTSGCLKRRNLHLCPPLMPR